MFNDSIKLLKTPWVYIVSLLCFVILILSLGADLFDLLYIDAPNSEEFFNKSFTAKEHSLSLPILAALPFSANCTQDFKSKFVRMTVFRMGIKPYVFAKTLALVIAVIITQTLGTMCFVLLLAIVCGDLFIAWNMFFARIFIGVVFAIVGSWFSLIQKDKTFAFVVPVAVSLFFSMVGERIFFDVDFMSFSNLLSGEFNFILIFFSFVLVIAYSIFLVFEVKNHG